MKNSIVASIIMLLFGFTVNAQKISKNAIGLSTQQATN